MGEKKKGIEERGKEERAEELIEEADEIRGAAESQLVEEQ